MRGAVAPSEGSPRQVVGHPRPARAEVKPVGGGVEVHVALGAGRRGAGWRAGPWADDGGVALLVDEGRR